MPINTRSRRQGGRSMEIKCPSPCGKTFDLHSLRDMQGKLRRHMLVCGAMSDEFVEKITKE